MPWLAHHENEGPAAVGDPVGQRGNPSHSTQQQVLDQAGQSPSPEEDSTIQRDDPSVVG